MAHPVPLDPQLDKSTVISCIFLLLFAISTATVLKRGLNTGASWAIFVGTVLNFGFGTAQWAGLVAGAIIETRILLVEHPDMPLENRGVIFQSTVLKLLTPFAAMEAIPMIISDAIVIWRAWSLFPGQRWVMIVPVSLLLGSFVMWIVVVERANNPNASPTIVGFMAYLSLSLATNLITTFLIGWKLWTHRKFLIGDLGLGPRKSPVQKIFLILVESGLIFALFQPAAINAENVLNVAFLMLSAFYPSIVVLLVHTHRSYIDTIDFGSGNSAVRSRSEVPLSHISFVVPSLSRREDEWQQSAPDLIHHRSKHEKEDAVEGSDTLEIITAVERDSAEHKAN
ncbi:hypothetical protein BDZ97DRAFT_1922629 [Flammula alnicola]|nr:hypothetical protein BDZ97DRAFT_1922629 [Flammula alnicola]